MRSNSPAALEHAAPHLPLGWTPLDPPYKGGEDKGEPSPRDDGTQREPSPRGGGTEGGNENEVDILYSLRLAHPEPVEGPNRKGLRPYHLLYCGSALLSRTRELPQLLTTLENHAELLTAFRAQEHLFVHAGVVAWNGKAIIIPGRSMSGKTTLVRALLAAGAEYYSDEFAVLDAEGRVHPYPVPISIREGDNLVGCKIPLETLDIQPGSEPLPVGLIVVAKYKRYARWQPETLTPSQSMLALMDNTVAARREPTFTMPILKKVAMRAKTIAGKRGEAQRIVPAILSVIANGA